MMMRIAIAGTNGLALTIAHWIKEETSHQLILLSRYEQPTLSAQGYEVMAVDYDDVTSVQHALLGVDTVISTITRDPQLRLIQAAIGNGVRRFIPAEFEGPPNLRPSYNPLDQGRSTALQWLHHYRNQGRIQFTVFVCGILYERFAPGGLSQYNLGLESSLSGEGDYIANLRTMAAQAPIYDANGQPSVTISMTGMNEVALWVVKALGMSQWPTEMTMLGERMTVYEMTRVMEQARARQFNPQSITWHNPASLQSELALAQSMGDGPRELRAHAHIATAAGRYHFHQPYLNTRFPEVQPERFADWVARVWPAGV